MALLKPLTTEEQTIVLPTLIKFLKRNTNDSKSVTSEKIIEWFQKYQDRIGYKAAFNKQRLMKLVNHIRMNNLIPLYSGGEGYCVTKDPVKMEQLILEFQGRIESHVAMMNALKKTKADLELEIQIRAFEESKMKRQKYQEKRKQIDDIFDTISRDDLSSTNVDEWSKPEDLFK